MTDAMSQEFGALVDPSACTAKVWVPRTDATHPEWLNVLKQCRKPREAGGDLCKLHLKRQLVHSKIGDRMSQELYDKCSKEREARGSRPKVARRGRHWYTRHHMWQEAVRVRALPCLLYTSRAHET